MTRLGGVDRGTVGASHSAISRRRPAARGHQLHYSGTELRSHAMGRLSLVVCLTEVMKGHSSHSRRCQRALVKLYCRILLLRRTLPAPARSTWSKG